MCYRQILTLVVGLVIVNTHNVWVADWPVAITLLGWLAIVSGIVRTALPGVTKSMGEVVLSSRPFLIVSVIVQVVFGVWLSWVGYF